jgi:superfamily II DNA helicase RecQ
VFLDEVHLYVDHGVSFREDIAGLRESFFSLVFPRNKPMVHPSFCAMTGTFTREHISDLSDLLSFQIPQTGIQWGTMEDFSRREIAILASVSDDFTTTALNPFLHDIQCGEGGSIKGIVYCNSVKDAEKKLLRINTMLDDAVDFVGDALLIDGRQHKTEKIVNTKVFLGQVDQSLLTPVILVATSERQIVA